MVVLMMDVFRVSSSVYLVKFVVYFNIWNIISPYRRTRAEVGPNGYSSERKWNREEARTHFSAVAEFTQSFCAEFSYFSLFFFPRRWAPLQTEIEEFLISARHGWNFARMRILLYKRGYGSILLKAKRCFFYYAHYNKCKGSCIFCTVKYANVRVILFIQFLYFYFRSSRDKSWIRGIFGNLWSLVIETISAQSPFSRFIQDNFFASENTGVKWKPCFCNRPECLYICRWTFLYTKSFPACIIHFWQPFRMT